MTIPPQPSIPSKGNGEPEAKTPISDAEAQTTSSLSASPITTTRLGYPLVLPILSGGKDPYSQIKWKNVSAVIYDTSGKETFRQDNVDFPEFYSDYAIGIIAQKYFRGPLNSPTRERSLRQMVDRVADTLTKWGIEGGYFTDDEAQAFNLELKYLLVNQYMSFNSPVWFNLGVREKPQCSACFILGIEDSLESIRKWVVNESIIFAGGSGAGINLSRLRAQGEPISRGGTSSGPLAFMAWADSGAGSIKSGGTTRRAAKMVILNIDHPDILAFIRAKQREEEKARLLAAAGFDLSFNGEDWISIQFQNANHSVRVTDEFMRAVAEDKEWHTRYRVSGEIAHTYRARELWDAICDAAWSCADPGLQFHDTVNRWHTCPADGEIEASNPCSEYMFLNNTACNLASLNLMKFLKEDGSFDLEAYRQAIRVTFMAQEIIVGNAGYPTEEITEMSAIYRTIGLGFTNLGAVLMIKGFPYDSDEARAYAATLTSILTGEAYLTSARIAERLGPFPAYERNRDATIRVMNQHREASRQIDPRLLPETDEILVRSANRIWDETVTLGEKAGFRNAQASVIAPTGTISFMMDASTTGIEPCLALVQYKQLVGGGTLRIVNRAVPLSLERLGYSKVEIGEICKYINERGTIEGAPHLKEEHLPIFDCSFVPANGSRFIHPMGHVRMMASVQPFVSGAISKTVNLPESATPADISEIYRKAHELGLKAIAVYRDGSKQVQPLTTSLEDKINWRVNILDKFSLRAIKKRLPKTLHSKRHKVSLGDTEFYIHAGTYPDSGKLAEIFIDIAKEGSTVAGLLNAICIQISDALQRGTPLKDIIRKHIGTRFEPSGFTGEKEIPYASSILDYLMKWLALNYLNPEEREEIGINGQLRQSGNASANGNSRNSSVRAYALTCNHCGNLMELTGSCWTCPNCGNNYGSCG